MVVAASRSSAAARLEDLRVREERTLPPSTPLGYRVAGARNWNHERESIFGIPIEPEKVSSSLSFKKAKRKRFCRRLFVLQN